MTSEQKQELKSLAALVAIAEIVEDTTARPTRRLERIVKVLQGAGVSVQPVRVVEMPARKPEAPR